MAASLLVEMLQQQQITPAMFARSAHSLLDRFVRGALPQRIPVLMTLVEAVAANAPASGNTQFMHLLADLSGELLKHDAVSGANALTRLASVLSNELKASVGDEIAEDLAAVERAGDSLVSYTPHLDVLAAYGNALSGEARRKLSDLVTRLLGPAKDDNEIRIALDLLRRVPGIRKTAGMKSNLSRLVDHAEFGELARELVGGR